MTTPDLAELRRLCERRIANHVALPGDCWRCDSDRTTIALLDHIEQQERELEQTRVQLAGCSVAALGAETDGCQKGDYGWSVSFEDVRALRAKFEQQEREIERLKDGHLTREWKTEAERLAGECNIWIAELADAKREIERLTTRIDCAECRQIVRRRLGLPLPPGPERPPGKHMRGCPVETAEAELVAAREANIQLESRLQTAYDMMDTLGWERTRAGSEGSNGA